MVEWFHSNYEDPADQTPYETAEGGYQWIWGGPYDASEEIEGMFGNLISEALIKQAVAEVQSDGIVDWAPTFKPDDYNGDSQSTELDALDETQDEPGTVFGSPDELAARQKAVDALINLEKSLRARPVGIGHNQPPDTLQEIEAGVVGNPASTAKQLREEIEKQSIYSPWSGCLHDGLSGQRCA